MKRLPHSCFANARRQNEVDQMIRELEHERTLAQAIAFAESLRESGSDDDRDLPHTEKVPIIENDILAEQLEKNFIDSRQEGDTGNYNGSTGETSRKGKAESDENITWESDSSVSDMGRTEKISGAELEKPHPSEDVKEKHAPNSGVQKDETPGLKNPGRGQSQVMFTDQTMKEAETKKKIVNHGFDFLNEYDNVVGENISESLGGPPNTRLTHPTVPVASDMWQSPLDTPKDLQIQD